MVRISVIIPTRDRGADLRRCLNALLECAHRLDGSSCRATLHQVIVVDDASVTESATAAARSSPLPVEVLRNRDRRGAGASRRLGVEAAGGDVLAFLDDDAAPRGDWLIQAADVKESRPAVTGRVLCFDDSLLSQARQARYDARYTRLERDAPVMFFAGGNSSVLTEAFHEVGGFSQEGTGGDNSLAQVLNERGSPVRFRPELVIAHRNGKGWQRAFVDAWSSGRQHTGRMPLPEGLRALRDGAVGSTRTVREVNRLLGAVHVVGRIRGLKST
ncbi:glycosyltransferase family 2 protein [Streptosporangium sp. DT93]|uniref:glycosyltransferase family 2 protein n=1 Tax=Streptosporangium sp. DT93 TaxID=3393428 RepID=UPI003CEB1D69